MRTNERRGSVVVLVAILMVVLLGFGAFAVDISQMQAYKSELRRTADAAALAAALQLLNDAQFTNAPSAAQDLVTDNPVMGDRATITRMEFGEYSRTNGYQFVASCLDPSCTAAQLAAANAVRLSLSDTGSFYLAQFIGSEQFSLSVDAVAYLPVFATPCAAPWSISETEWFSKFSVLPSANPQPLSNLRNWPNTDARKRFVLKRPENESGSREVFSGAVNLPPYPASSGVSGVVNYANNIALGTCHQLAAGMELQTKMGWLDDATIDGASGGGVGMLCAAMPAFNCYNRGGQVGVAVRVPILADVPLAPGTACASTILYPEDEYTSALPLSQHGSIRCHTVLDVGTFVVVAVVSSGSEKGAVSAVFAGTQVVGPVRGFAQRPVLVQ